METKKLVSCDTFVCMPAGTSKDVIIFGKNSDRPEGEVQEIIYNPKQTFAPGSKLQCTYIEIDQIPETHGVILSKPSWMWGAEMGANEFGVVIGNEAVWTKLNNSHEDLTEKLLGMDLLRLGLERGKTAVEALQIITDLLAKHGQGGPCSDTMTSFSYHNSFLIADKKEAWVLETAANFWAAEKVESVWRNISNSLSIGTKIDLMSPGLKEQTKKMKLWDGKEPFHFTNVFSDSDADERFLSGGRLLEKLSNSKQFDIKSMMAILRDERSGICRGCDDSFPSTSSQVSILNNSTNSTPDCHWFTGTPDPKYSMYKPFIFCDNGDVPLTSITRSPTVADDQDPAKLKPRFLTEIDRRHELHEAHEKFYPKLAKKSNRALRDAFVELEHSLIDTVDNLLNNWNTPNTENSNSEKVKNLFNESAEKELSFYQKSA